MRRKKALWRLRKAFVIAGLVLVVIGVLSTLVGISYEHSPRVVTLSQPLRVAPSEVSEYRAMVYVGDVFWKCGGYGGWIFLGTPRNCRESMGWIPKDDVEVIFWLENLFHAFRHVEYVAPPEPLGGDV